MKACAFWLYACLMWLAQPFLRRKLARRSQHEPGYAEAVEERFGHYRQPVESRAALVWIHAVSLGETRAAAVLLKALREQHPALRILLTHGTATGRAEGRALLRPGDVQVWLPWDTPAATARFFEHFKPRLGLLMETEVWPASLAAAKKRGIPVLLLNARLSEKSLAQALQLSPLSFPAYAALTAVFAQTEADARRFRQIGVDAAGVFGNIKFDAVPDLTLQQRGQAWLQTLQQADDAVSDLVMFASSREGEESLFFKQISAVVQSPRTQSAIDTVANETPAPRPRFLLVPRHPQRFDEVSALAHLHGLKVSRRSDWPQGGPADDPAALSADVWLGDSLGEMALYYGMSDVALLGGSFAPLGGQNLIEAAACGCPVLMGPHTNNFAEAAELSQAAGAARRVADMPEAVLAALALVGDKTALAQAGAACQAFSQQHRGATARTLQALQVYL